jgi:GH18 family chitinase
MRFEKSTEADVVRRIYDLKAANPNLKHILALGGGVDSADSAKYSRMVFSAWLRTSFVRQCVEFLKKYNFNGLDKNFHCFYISHD